MPKRTTITLDDDVFDKLKTEVRRTGAPFKQVVNDTLRRQLNQRRKEPLPPFRIKARRLEPRPGIDIDNVWGLIEQLDGPAHK